MRPDLSCEDVERILSARREAQRAVEPGPNATRDDALFARVLVAHGLAAPGDVASALRAQACLQDRGVLVRVRDVLVGRGLLDEAQAIRTLGLEEHDPLVCPACARTFMVDGPGSRPALPCPLCSRPLVLPVDGGGLAAGRPAAAPPASPPAAASPAAPPASPTGLATLPPHELAGGPSRGPAPFLNRAAGTMAPFIPPAAAPAAEGGTLAPFIPDGGGTVDTRTVLPDLDQGAASPAPVTPPSLVSARSSAGRKVHVDLDTICLKCLENEPSRRYASVAALAADLRRFMEGDAIGPRPLACTTEHA